MQVVAIRSCVSRGADRATWSSSRRTIVHTHHGAPHELRAGSCKPIPWVYTWQTTDTCLVASSCDKLKRDQPSQVKKRSGAFGAAWSPSAPVPPAAPRALAGARANFATYLRRLTRNHDEKSLQILVVPFNHFTYHAARICVKTRRAFVLLF